MRHVPNGRLRRLLDEPFAVPDRDGQHVAACPRCSGRVRAMREDAEAVHHVLGVAPVVASEPRTAPSQAAAARPREIRVPSHLRWRVLGASFGTGATVAAGALVLAGVAAAATLTTVFAPTQVAPLTVSSGDLQAVAQLMSLNSPMTLGGFDSAAGTQTTSFGTISWSSSGKRQQEASLAEAESATGLALNLPSSLPHGVGAPTRFVTLPKVTADITFDGSAAGALRGSTMTVTIGPAIAVSFAPSPGSTHIDPLAAASIAQPVVTSTGATTDQIESFLLSQPGIPADLATQLRMLGNLQHTLPIPAPSGANATSTQVDGLSAVVISDSSGALSGAIWEEHSGEIHLAAGILDEQDLLDVAQQIG